jgi:hypothetical protein
VPTLTLGHFYAPLSRMNDSRKTGGGPAFPEGRRRRRRGIVLKGGKAPLGAKELERHARLIAEGRPMSGRSGSYVYYMRKGRQRWHRYIIPRDPRTPAQQRSRAIFGAASKTWSESKELTDEQRDAWRADAAKRQSRPRLGSSGPLTSQQDFVGRNSAKDQRDSGMRLHPSKRERDKTKSREPKLESTREVAQSQSLTQSTRGTRRALTVYAPSPHHVARGYARKARGRKLMSQVSRFQRVTRSAWERRRTNTGAPPRQHRWKSGHAGGVGNVGARKQSSGLARGRRSAHCYGRRRGG